MFPPTLEQPLTATTSVINVILRVIDCFACVCIVSQPFVLFGYHTVRSTLEVGIGNGSEYAPCNEGIPFDLLEEPH